jgi:hypothetical protein
MGDSVTIVLLDEKLLVMEWLSKGRVKENLMS